MMWLFWFYHHILVPILVIGVLVSIHEFGHFIVAKLCGVGIVKFSIGFGPALWKHRRKETEYQICLIPLGGFVRMVGDMPDALTGKQATDREVRGEKSAGSELESDELRPELQEVIKDENRWFIRKNFWQRSGIVVAGPLFNYLLAIVTVFIAVIFYGEERLEELPKIGTVMAGSPAEKGGLLPGDFVSSIDGKATNTWEDLAGTVHRGTGLPITLSVRRGEEKLSLIVQPQQKEIRVLTGEKKAAYFIGIGPSVSHVAVGPVGAAKFGLLWTIDKTQLTYMGLWGMVTGTVSPKDLAGPLFILDTAGKQSKEGFDSLLYFLALLSVSLAVLNLLPIPVLDGGHLMFFLIEAVIGPISMRKKEFAQQVGMFLLLCLMVFAIHNDIFREPIKSDSSIEWDQDKENSPSPSQKNAPGVSAVAQQPQATGESK